MTSPKSVTLHRPHVHSSYLDTQYGNKYIFQFLRRNILNPNNVSQNVNSDFIVIHTSATVLILTNLDFTESVLIRISLFDDVLSLFKSSGTGGGMRPGTRTWTLL